MRNRKRLIRIGIIIFALLLAEVFLLTRNPNAKESNSGDNIDSSINSGTQDSSAEGTSAGDETDDQITDAETDDLKNYSESEHLVSGLHGTNPTLVKEGDPYIESGAFCIDDRTGVVKEVEISGSVDTSIPGDYEIVYTFISENTKCTVTRNVHVVQKEIFKEKTDGVAVFMYHYVYTEDDVPESLNGNYILDTELEAQLAWLRDNDFYFPSFAELRAFIDGEISLPENCCILTFDDGQKGFLKYGIPLLEKYQIPATSFLIVHKDAEGIMTKNASPYISFESHSFDMHRAGGTIGHGGIISALTKDEIVNDLKEAIDILGSSDAFAYPYGDYTDDAELAVIEAGILCSFTTEYDWVHPGDNPALLPRVRIVGDAGLDAFIGSI